MLVFLFLFILKAEAGVFDGCDYDINMDYGKTVVIKSFNYPQTYPSTQSCRWKFSSPEPTTIFLSCTGLQQPLEEDCLGISIDHGIKQPSYGPFELFCRSNSFSVRSLIRNGLTMTINNHKGHSDGTPFKCFATAETGTYEGCDHSWNLESDQKEIKIQSPNYPFAIELGTSCRWDVRSPPTTQILLSCPNPNQPQVEPCEEWFTVSPEGIQSFTLLSTTTYCRHFGFKIGSANNRMVIAYNTRLHNKTATAFECYLSVEGALNIRPGWRDEECSCGRRNTSQTSRIIDGEVASVNEFPTMALLVNTLTSETYCGATIISEYWALTACQCTLRAPAKELGLIVSEHDRSQEGEIETTDIHKIDRFVRHPDYNTSGNRDHDIALVHLTDALTFNRNIGPACLPFSNRNQSLAGKWVTSLGWGGTDLNGLVTNVLKKVVVMVDFEERCPVSLYEKFYEKTFCTKAEGRDFTFGDSGGPALWLDPVTSQWKVVGIHCGSSVHASKDMNQITRVSYFLDWIESNTDGAVFCKK